MVAARLSALANILFDRSAPAELLAMAVPRART